jgi:hypothetical protein
MSNKDLAAEYFDAVWSQHYNPEKIRLLADSALLWRYPCTASSMAQSPSSRC